MTLNWDRNSNLDNDSGGRCVKIPFDLEAKKVFRVRIKRFSPIQQKFNFIQKYGVEGNTLINSRTEAMYKTQWNGFF